MQQMLKTYIHSLCFRPLSTALRRAIHGDLVRMADDLRRISALQVEFGVFTSCATIRGRGDPSACSRGDHTPACWRILKDRLSGLEEQLHGSQVKGTSIIAALV